MSGARIASLAAAHDGARPLAGRHAVVTGGGRGIGLAIAGRLAAFGASVSLLGRDRDRLEAARRQLPAGTDCATHACDVADARAVDEAFAGLARDGRPVAILVNNAGVAQSAKLAATDDALWQRMIATNLTGTFLCTRAALPLLLAAPAGRVVNVASTAGLVGYPYVAAYCAAKHGVVGLTRALALELARTSVTVNAVCPGYTDTGLVDEAIGNIVRSTGRSAAAARAALVGRNPQQRLVTPDEVASAVAWLCLPESQSVTGQAIAVAGGEVTTG
jgi:NAD(P)-dependent dehydrogenase (short-subunit alcohol dehydrogenase family)